MTRLSCNYCCCFLAFYLLWCYFLLISRFSFSLRALLLYRNWTLFRLTSRGYGFLPRFFFYYILHLLILFTYFLSFFILLSIVFLLWENNIPSFFFTTSFFSYSFLWFNSLSEMSSILTGVLSFIIFMLLLWFLFKSFCFLMGLNLILAVNLFIYFSKSIRYYL